MTIKTLIAVPCMQSVPTRFLRSLEYMQRLPDSYTIVSENTLIHDARNDFASIAIQNDFDRVLWIDSDMVFDKDLMLRLSKHLDDGLDMVSGIYFQRVPPAKPVIYKALNKIWVDGSPWTEMDEGRYPDTWLLQPEHFFDYPKDALFEIAACGFGAVMTSVPLLKAAWDQFGPPFAFFRNIGEDMSFCYRVHKLGGKIWCDSSIRCGHVGHAVYDEQAYEVFRKAEEMKQKTGQQKTTPTQPTDPPSD